MCTLVGFTSLPSASFIYGALGVELDKAALCNSYGRGPSRLLLYTVVCDFKALVGEVIVNQDMLAIPKIIFFDQGLTSINVVSPLTTFSGILLFTKEFMTTS